MIRGLVVRAGVVVIAATAVVIALAWLYAPGLAE